MKRVLMIGPSKSVKGGISQLIKNYLDSPKFTKVEIKHVATHVDRSKLVKLFKAMWAYVEFAYRLVSYKPDIIHIHMAEGPSFFRKSIIYYMSKACRKVIILHMHSGYFPEFYENASCRVQKMIQQVLGGANIIVVLSDVWVDEYRKIAPNATYKVIPNGINIDAIEASERFDHQGYRIISFLGAINLNKGIKEILYAAKSVLETYSDVVFVLGGSGDVLEWQRVAKDMGIDKRVLFTGWLNETDKWSLLKNSFIYLQPSYREVMPMGIIEALVSDVPVIATNCGSVPDVIREGWNGELIEVGNHEALAQRIRLYLEDDGYRRKISDNINKFEARKYRIEKGVEALERTYVDLTS